MYYSTALTMLLVETIEFVDTTLSTTRVLDAVEIEEKEKLLTMLFIRTTELVAVKLNCLAMLTSLVAVLVLVTDLIAATPLAIVKVLLLEAVIT
jgi:hypothetical protein